MTRASLFALLLLTGMPVANASGSGEDWLDRARAVTQWLTGIGQRDAEIIVPPNVDPAMAVTPPGGGILRIIRPPDPPGIQR